MDEGDGMPATMRPIIVAKGAVWGAAAPTEMVVWGGMEGEPRVKRMRPV